MKPKKIIISAIALIVIFASIFSVWQWQKKIDGQPVRQEREIRQ